MTKSEIVTDKRFMIVPPSDVLEFESRIISDSVLFAGPSAPILLRHDEDRKSPLALSHSKIPGTFIHVNKLNYVFCVRKVCS